MHYFFILFKKFVICSRSQKRMPSLFHQRQVFCWQKSVNQLCPKPQNWRARLQFCGFGPALELTQKMSRNTIIDSINYLSFLFLASKNSTTKTIGKLLHARTTTKSTTTTTTTTLVPTTRRRKTISTSKPKRPKIFFIKPITINQSIRKRLTSAKDMNLKDRNTKSLIGYNGLFDLNSLKVFTKGNMTSLSSWRNGC